MFKIDRYLFIAFALFLLHSCKKEELSTLSTTPITNITATSATGGGNITSDGGAKVNAKGVCWGVNADPTTLDSKTNDGGGIGQFVSNLSELTAGSTYHVRAYATNSVGTAYGADLSFATLGKAPECITQPAMNITSSGATLNGTVKANDLSTTVTFEYGTTTSYGQIITSAQSPVTGNNITNVSADISGLTPGTTYHYRIKVINSIGTTNGNDLTFTSGSIIPTITTTLVSNVSTNSATTGGNITSDGGAIVTARGVCWATTPNPTTSSNKTSDGTGTGTFTSSLTSLIPGTTYYVRAFATNMVGTSYGFEETFTTSVVQPPTVSTTPPSSISYVSAVSGGNVTSDGGASITARGVCWAIISNPTINDDRTIDGIGTGAYNSNITCLSFATTYYVRAYATNSVGTVYGDQQSFTTQGTNPIIFNPDLTYGSVTDMDGNCYKTIQIGTQIWMAENLKTTRYNDGTLIPNITDNNEWANLAFAEWVGDQTPLTYVTYGAYCWYNNDEATYENTYGKLYNWGAVGTKKLCPAGWHVPSIEEWLIVCHDETDWGSGPYGEELMEEGGTHWEISILSGTNETGFTALPGGIRDHTGTFSGISQTGSYWAGNELGHPVYKYSHPIYFYARAIEHHFTEFLSSERNGFSVRCLKD